MMSDLQAAVEVARVRLEPRRPRRFGASPVPVPAQTFAELVKVADDLRASVPADLVQVGP